MRTPEQTEALLDRLESIIGEYDAADDRFKRGQWSDKYKDKLSPYADKLKLLNGDDFDIFNESYDEYNKDYKDISDDEYTDSLVDNIKKVMNRIWPEVPGPVADLAAESVGKVAEGVKGKIDEAEDKNNEDKPNSVEITSIEAKPEEQLEEETDSIDDETEEQPETSAEDQFIKELEDYKSKMPKRK